jgi:hypothetical protein
VPEFEASIQVDENRVFSITVSSTLIGKERGEPGFYCEFQAANIANGTVLQKDVEARVPVQGSVASSSSFGLRATATGYRLNLSQVTLASCTPRSLWWPREVLIRKGSATCVRVH